MTRETIEAVQVVAEAIESVHLDTSSSPPIPPSEGRLDDTSSYSSFSSLCTPGPSSDADSSQTPLTTPSGAPFKSRYGPSANPKKVTPFTFGQRLLSSTDNPWDYNAWDHATPDPEYLAHMAQQLEAQKSNPVTPFDRKRFHSHPDKFWNKFYTNNNVNFFKDRKWLGQEFPLLREACALGARSFRVLEVGAGAGNTLFPVLSQNQSRNFHITAADFSKVSVELIRSQEDFIKNYPTHVDAKVWDLSDPNPAHLPCPPGSIDIIVLIFVFSALAPWQWKTAIHNIKSMLRPGGSVLFRDYGRGDLAQVRMKGGRWLGENFYVRGDGTRVYFFEEEEVSDVFEERWEGLGLERWEAEKRKVEEGVGVGPWGGRVGRKDVGESEAEGEKEGEKEGEGEGEGEWEEGEREGDEGESSKSDNGNRRSNETAEGVPHTLLESTTVSTSTTLLTTTSIPPPTTSTPIPLDLDSVPKPTRLVVSKIGTDRRMLVNRKRQLKMYRCWLQMQCEKEEMEVEVEVEEEIVHEVGSGGKLVGAAP